MIEKVKRYSTDTILIMFCNTNSTLIFDSRFKIYKNLSNQKIQLTTNQNTKNKLILRGSVYKALKKLFFRYQAVVIILIASAFGLLEPVPSEPLEILVVPIVALLIFTSLDAINIENIPPSLHVSRVILGLGIGFGVLPVLGMMFGRLLLNEADLAGLIVILTGPTTAGSALAWARLSHSDIITTGLLILLTILLAPVVTPILIIRLITDGVSVSVLPILTDLILIVGVGTLLHFMVPSKLRTESALNRISLLSIAALVYIGVATSGVEILEAMKIGRILLVTSAVLGISYVGILFVGRLMGLTSGETRGLYLGSTMKNLGVAIAVASAVPIEGIIVSIIIFYVTQQVIAGVITARVNS